MMTIEKKRVNQIGGPHQSHHDCIKTIFITQLSDIFSIKHCLSECLPLFAANVSYPNFKLAILENVEEINIQLIRMKEIFDLLGEKYEAQECDEVKAITHEFIKTINTATVSDLETDLGILFHLVTLADMEILSYSILYELAESIHDRAVLFLLRQNLDMAKDNKELYELIIHEYINSGKIKKGRKFF
jgi:ferritin-like metal-binding protein YciE